MFEIVTGYCFSGSVYRVRFGANRLDSDEFGALIGQSTESILHANYSDVTLYNDIGLIRVAICYTGECCYILCSLLSNVRNAKIWQNFEVTGSLNSERLILQYP
jgi:hypothetical protein